METLWNHSLATAYAALIVATDLGLPNPEKCSLMGLFHDLGKMLLVKRLGERYNPTKHGDLAEYMPLIDHAHTRFGSYVLNRWSFSKKFGTIALLHEDPDFPPHTEKELLIIHLVNNLTRTIGYSTYCDQVDLSALASTRLLGIGAEELERIAARTTEFMAEAINRKN